MLNDGVADYALALGRALQARESIRSWFLCGDPLDSIDGQEWQDGSSKLKRRTGNDLVSALEGNAEPVGVAKEMAVLLHYVNYGYAPRGCPFWLIDGLMRWKQRRPNACLVTMFHELYASGPPWRSSFWLSPVQRHLAGRLARLSDFCVTSSELYRRKLSDWASAKRAQIVVRPVFSTVGEPAESAPWGDRQPRMAVLGRAGTEARAYGRHQRALTAMARALSIEEIMDIGPRSRPVPLSVEGIRVRTTGQLPREEVSKLLSGCRAGFLDYPSDVLAKSTIFAAYCAHGVVPVITQLRDAGLDELREGEHFLVARTQEAAAPPSQAALEDISKAASDWYRGHALFVQAAALSRLLASCSRG